MSVPRLLIALLVLATVLVDCVVWLCVDPFDCHEYVGTALIVLMYAQVSLAAIWVAYSGKWSPWVALVLCMMVVCWASFDPVPLFDLTTFWTVLLLLQATLIVVAIGVLRVLGVRLVLASRDCQPMEDTGRQPRWQFSLGHLFSWTTAVAIALGMLTFTTRYEPFLLDAWAWIVVPPMINTTIAIVALWLTLGKKNWRLRLALGLTILALVGFLWFTSIDVAIFCLILFGGQTLWLSISLLVVRVAGFRLLRDRSSRDRSSMKQATTAETV